MISKEQITTRSFEKVCGNLPHGGFALSDRAAFVVTSSGPGSALALCSGRVWEAAIWGATEKWVWFHHSGNVTCSR
jgi:hypothetical protein